MACCSRSNARRNAVSFGAVSGMTVASPGRRVRAPHARQEQGQAQARVGHTVAVAVGVAHDQAAQPQAAKIVR